MKYLSAYALAWLGGKASPSMRDLEAIINSVGGDFDKAQAEIVIEALTERDVCQLIRTGLTKLQTTGGMSSSPGAAAVGSSETKKEEKVEEKKDDKKDEDIDFEGGIGGMFDDDF